MSTPIASTDTSSTPSSPLPDSTCSPRCDTLGNTAACLLAPALSPCRTCCTPACRPGRILSPSVSLLTNVPREATVPRGTLPGQGGRQCFAPHVRHLGASIFGPPFLRRTRTHPQVCAVDPLHNHSLRYRLRPSLYRTV